MTKENQTRVIECEIPFGVNEVVNWGMYKISDEDDQGFVDIRELELMIKNAGVTRIGETRVNDREMVYWQNCQGGSLKRFYVTPQTDKDLDEYISNTLMHDVYG